jgi:hypothetical protein
MLGSVAPAAAQVALNPDYPRTYVVQPGDTLWDIAGRFLRQPWRWRDVWEANPGVDNPNLIYPGDVLELTFREGRPRIRRAGASGGMRTVKLSPRVRVTELERAIPAIPINAVAPFLSRPLVADADEIDALDYVVGFPEGQLVASSGDEIYVRTILAAEEDRYEILRPGQEYRDPASGELLGFQATYVGAARLERFGDPATLRVSSTEREVAIGDRVRSARDEEPIRSFFPEAAPAGMIGQIIAVLNGVSQIGQFDVVVLNKGSEDRVQVGHVFEAYSGGGVRRDEVRTRRADWNWRNETPLDSSFWLGEWEYDGWNRNRPSENAPLPLHRRAVRPYSEYIEPDSRSGIVMVFKVFSRVSFGLVMHATRAMHIGETISAPRAL